VILKWVYEAIPQLKNLSKLTFNVRSNKSEENILPALEDSLSNLSKLTEL